MRLPPCPGGPEALPARVPLVLNAGHGRASCPTGAIWRGGPGTKQSARRPARRAEALARIYLFAYCPSGRVPRGHAQPRFRDTRADSLTRSKGLSGTEVAISRRAGGGLTPRLRRRWLARRSAIATMVSVGGAAPAVGKTELPATNRLAMPCSLPSASTTPRFGLSSARVVPIWCQPPSRLAGQP